jgi:hypothetical protein
VSCSESENLHNHVSRYPEMDDELPILKGILNGEVKYHNARRYFLCLMFAAICKFCRFLLVQQVYIDRILSLFLPVCVYLLVHLAFPTNDVFQSIETYSSL